MAYAVIKRKFLHWNIHRVILLAFVELLILLLFFRFKATCDILNKCEVESTDGMTWKVYSGNDRYRYNQMSPLIFVGGFPRSGTTLMRAILDAHPDIRCGLETRVIPNFLNFRDHFFNKKEIRLINEAGISIELLNKATAKFILDIIVNHGEAAPRLCNKDPYTMAYAQYLSQLFPRAKMIFMVRDGRASIYSTITRNVTIGGLDPKDPRSCLEQWNKTVGYMYDECGLVGPSRCMMVHYEQLVLHPTYWVREILDFLEVPWDEAVLSHERQINQSGGVALSRYEKSSDQIIKPINIEALDKWVGFYSQEVVDEMDQIAPMLAKLGYNPKANPPNYGVPEDFVLKNTELVQNQIQFWKQKAIQLHIKTAMVQE